MKYIFLITLLLSDQLYACVTAVGEFSNKSELIDADSIFIASLATWKELDETPTASNIIPKNIYDPLIAITFNIESTVFGEPLNSYFAGVCFGDFQDNEKYIFLARKTRVYSYLENTQENINMIDEYLRNGNR